MSQIGTLEWSRTTAGTLSALDRFSIAASAVKLRLRRLLARASSAARADASALSLDSLRLPDSVAVRSTLALCESAYEPYLLNHCFRSYLWGGLVGQREQLKVDHEELLIAALLHDIGLTQQARTQIDCECFAVRGGLYAEQHLRGLGSNNLIPAVPRSICMHLNLVVSAETPLDYLLHQGASIDVVGWDLYKVGALKEQVLNRYPRCDFKARICEDLQREAREHPGARPALMVRLGFLQLIRQAPYAE